MALVPFGRKGGAKTDFDSPVQAIRQRGMPKQNRKEAIGGPVKELDTAWLSTRSGTAGGGTPKNKLDEFEHMDRVRVGE